MIDASDPHIGDRITVTDEILDRIGASQPRFYVFNQIDKCTRVQIKKLKTEYKHLKPIFVSAKIGEGIMNLKEQLQSFSS